MAADSAWQGNAGAGAGPADADGIPERAAQAHGAGAPTLCTLEHALLDRRRAAIDGPPPPAPAEGPPARPLYRALALSGGGIRSATFVLGVLQAIARDPRPPGPGTAEAPRSLFAQSRLSSFDYLSTVSGGGYTGAFLCSLFMANRLRSHDGLTRSARTAPHGGARAMMESAWRFLAGLFGHGQGAAGSAPRAPAPAPPAVLQARAAEDVVRVLGSGPPERIRADQDYTQGDAILRAPLAWLRENGRYLVPTGAGDAFYAAAIGIRNWLALHYVIGTVLMASVALVGMARALSAMWFKPVRAWEVDSLTIAGQGFAKMTGATCPAPAGAADCTSMLDLVWWSPFFPLALAPIVLLGVPLGVAFWLVKEREDGRSAPVNFAMLCTLAIGIAMMALAVWLWPHYVPGLLQGWAADDATDVMPALDRRALTFAVAAMAMAAAGLYVWVAIVNGGAAMQRVILTRRVADVLVLAAAIACIGLVDTLGQTLYLAVASLEGSPAPALAPAGLAVALSWMGKRISAQTGRKERPAWWDRVPLTTLAGVAGVLIFVLIGSLWSLFVHWIVWDGATPSPDEPFHGSGQFATLGWVLLVTTVLAVVVGHFAAFINLSSLQAFYGSRLTRAYLGASNGERFENGSAALSAAEPLDGDQVTMDDYFDAQAHVLRTLAPLHLINVTVNKTVDPAEQLVQRDRKGLPMAVLPMGFSMDDDARLGFPHPSFVNGVRRPLPVGQWIGTSGAAFATGIGRETSLGMSLLMGAANVRLGTWWESGLQRVGEGSMSSGNPATLLRHALGAVFRTQTYLSYELRARFHGTQRRWQYLSDGGHFENTGLYELLRRNRRIYQIVCCDAGADPKYQFDDLANLIRLARIDLRVEITVQTEFSGVLASVFGDPRDFKPRAAPAPEAAGGTAAGVGATPASPTPPPATPCALLLWARHFDDTDRPSTQIVVIKPRVTRDVPVDVCQYADVHPQFPQQTTADQFFDEAQWESYRALGYHLGSKVFNREVMAALDQLARETIQPAVSRGA
jgi:hypothetical protein